MSSAIQIGSILIKKQPFMSERLGLESDSYSQNWSVVRAVNGFSLDRRVRAAERGGAGQGLKRSSSQ